MARQNTRSVFPDLLRLTTSDLLYETGQYPVNPASGLDHRHVGSQSS